MTLGMHLCRGNFRSRWLAAGGYEAVAERLFNECAVDGFFLEYDDQRAGGFEPLRFMPKNKFAVLTLRRRIDEAAKYVDLDRLSLSPQCGFASTVGGNLLIAEDQRKEA